MLLRDRRRRAQRPHRIARKVTKIRGAPGGFFISRDARRRDVPRTAAAVASAGIASSMPSARKNQPASGNGNGSVHRLVLEAQDSAKDAGLRYVTDTIPGITRRRVGKSGFAYLMPDGKRVRDADTHQRIKSLVIPPAWEEVWICPYASGHLQATGRDQRGRKQAKYHPKFREAREETKYERVIDFAHALPRIRRTVRQHLKLPGHPRQKVLAAVVSLLEKTLIRVGNEEYARSNKSYGLTTIHNRHVKVKGSTLTFRFVGKSGIDHEVAIDNPRIARIVRKCQELPGEQLFEYLDDAGQRRDVKSDDVNAYLKEITGQDFTAKDFRTWAGTVLAARALREFEQFDSATQAKRNVVQAIETVARRLGNTRAVCRKCYIHPAILNTYLDGTMAKVLQKRAERALRHVSQLKAEEAAVIALIRDQMKRAGRSG
jgi:DNA topoisomerase-1